VPADQSAQSARDYQERAELARQAGLMVALAIVDVESGALVGSCDIRRPDPIDPAIGELGYLLAAEARGRGLATRAIWLLTDWSFRELGMERVQALVHPDNRASARLLERLGFAREGLLRQYRAGANGREDRNVYSAMPGELVAMS
jgi:RimJ/RimL family protein N-acetyltransferase